MKRYKLAQIGLLFIVYGLLMVNSYAEEAISSVELINHTMEYDGKEIVFQGEVIGDIMKRGSFCWLNISDGKNAVGVFLDNAIIASIKFTGDYRQIGDIVVVKGIFHRACLEHGGDLDIHAQYITKVVSGKPSPMPMDVKKAYIAFLLSIMTISAFLLLRLPKGRVFYFNNR